MAQCGPVFSRQYRRSAAFTTVVEMLGVTPEGTGLNGTPGSCADSENVFIQEPAAMTALGQQLTFPNDCYQAVD